MPITERRLHPRIPVDYVTVEVYSGSEYDQAPDLSDICSVIDISETGMRFLSNQELDSTHLLRLTFTLPESLLFIRTKATIIHSIRTKRGIELGVTFDRMTTADRKLISHFVTRKIREVENKGTFYNQ